MKRLCFILILTLLTACNSTKRLHLLSAGETKQKEFHVTIPFEFRAGLPIVEIEINNIKSHFLFDTGAPNVVSSELAARLNLKTIATGGVEDSGGNTSTNQKFVSLSDVKIGTVNFLNTGAIIQNLGSSDIMNCIELDGIIGANLMKEAFWKIDYQNQTITLTNDLSKLNITDDYKLLKFRTKTSGTPLVNLSLNDIKLTNITFDTGSNGHIALPKYIYHKLKKANSMHTFSTGSTTYGVNGKAKSDTTYYEKVRNLKIGEVSLNHKVIEYKNNSDIIGTRFLENYNVILDWKSHTIYLKEIKPYDYNSVKGFGFKPDLKDGKLFVGALFKDSGSEGKLKIGDQILTINNLDFETMSKPDFCVIVKERKWDYNKSEQIDIKVKRDDSILTFQIQKRALLE